MKLSVERLFGRDVEVIELDQRLRLRDELAVRYPEGVRVVASVRKIEHGVYMEGFAEGQEAETCARCLEPFVRPARVEIAEVFSEDVPASEAQISDIAPLVGREIDVGELIVQLLESDEPIAPVCTPGCRGMCPMCGVNRNREQCDCRESGVDERLAGLAKFMQEPGVN